MKKVAPVFIFLFICYLLGAWNLEGLRQGTETFYLKISEDMFDFNSFLTPLYRGTPHWSKPPFVFWLSFPLYYILPIEHFFAARLSIILLTLILSYLFSKELELLTRQPIRSDQDTLIPWKNFFIILLTTFGFFRFGKIFMLDIPLTLTSALSILLFHNAYLAKNKKKFYYATLLLACSILIKGPVSLVMITGSLVLFFLVSYKVNKLPRSYVTYSMFYLALGTLLSSLWFFACYIKHGSEFIDYFFLRENIGKFQSASYPVRKIPQGLLLYSLPWSFALFFLNKKFFESFKLNLKNSSTLFLSSSFICFFSLWLFPSQRSHHYALPSIPFFLAIIYPLITDNFSLFFKKITGTLLLIFIFSSLFAFYIFQDQLGPLVPLNTLLLVGIFIIFLKKPPVIQTHGLLFLLSLSLFWSITLPQFALSKLPATAAKIIQNNPDANFYTVFKKNYYYEQITGKKVSSLGENAVRKHLASKIGSKQDFYLLTESFIKQRELSDSLEVLMKWRVWRRRLKFASIIQAITHKEPQKLQESYLLVRPRNRR